MGIPAITIDHVRAAAKRIGPHIHRTPVLTSATLDRQTGATVFCKCENLQKVGAFKARGATNAVLSLSKEEAARGVVTQSSGNHGAALAYAAGIRGIRCWVVMPDDAPRVKVDAVRGYGADVVFCTQSERDAAAAELQAETGAVLIHPFEDSRVIAGQATAALELLDQVPELDIVIAPIGGGGLLAGTSITVRALRPAAVIIGGEPANVDDSYRSMMTGERQPRVASGRSIADGTLAGIGANAYAILRDAGVRIVLASEEEIAAAAMFHLMHMKLVVEPSGALSLAALRNLGGEAKGKRIGLIVSGGNTDFKWLPGE